MCRRRISHLHSLLPPENMSLPPQIIQVKRLKRKARDDDDNDADGIVDYLRVDGDRKRYRSDTYIYQRTTPISPLDEAEIVPKSSRDAVPVIHASNPGEEEQSHIEKGPSPQKRRQEVTETPQIKSAGRDEVAEAAISSTLAERLTTPKSPTTTEPRRFHFSRPILAPSSLINAANSATGKRSRINNATTVFVERGHKRTRTEDVPMKDADASSTGGTPDSADEPPPQRKLKLPGSDRKGPMTKKNPTTVKKEVPVSMKKDWAGDLDLITRNMNDFALQLIGENLAEIEARDKKEAEAAAKRQAVNASKSPQTPRFKPKVPAQRYAERHPEAAAAESPAATASKPHEHEYESGSEDEYVVETYVRIPVSSLGKDVDPEKVGLLVFDNEPDLELFHREEGDSDDEWPEDDEDENAENYYTADYPDDEVDSEDEFNRAAYLYRTGNASDLEEYDERDVDDDIVLDGDGDDDEAPIPLSTRLGLQPPNAFSNRKL